jgi:hypothetical protein
MGVTLARNYPLKIHIIEIIPWILTPTECLTACVVASRVSLELIRRAVWRDKKTTLKLQKKKKKKKNYQRSPWCILLWLDMGGGEGHGESK